MLCLNPHYTHVLSSRPAGLYPISLRPIFFLHNNSIKKKVRVRPTLMPKAVRSTLGLVGDRARRAIVIILRSLPSITSDLRSVRPGRGGAGGV